MDVATFHRDRRPARARRPGSQGRLTGALLRLRWRWGPPKVESGLDPKRSSQFSPQTCQSRPLATTGLRPVGQPTPVAPNGLRAAKLVRTPGTSLREHASVEDFPEPGPLPVMMAVRISVVVVVSRVTAVSWMRSRGGGRSGRSGEGTFGDLVQFTPIQPNAAALRPIVDFDSLAVRHHQINLDTNRTFHRKQLQPTNDDQECTARRPSRATTRTEASLIRVESGQGGGRPRQERGAHRELPSPKPSRRVLNQPRAFRPDIGRHRNPIVRHPQRDQNRSS